MSVLDKICADKRAHIAGQKKKISFGALEDIASDMPQPKGFIGTLNHTDRYAIIAEVKKASPSKGVIRADFDPLTIANIYAENGAACLSVLTDEPYFQGKDDYFKTIRAAVDLPLLRKDFMLDPYQIIESRALGADCVLLIMAALSDDQAQELFTTANEFGMDTLFEVHDGKELDRAMSFGPKMVGVNNRNLKTLDVDLQTGLSLAENIPDDVLKVAESGLNTPGDLAMFSEAGYGAFLIGESLMRQNDIGAALSSLLQG